MNSAFFTSQVVFSAVKAAVTQIVVTPSDSDPDMGDRIVPLDLRQWLARLRLLDSVPFAYLTPDSLLLPPESIRFFYVDRNWTDALIQGALSVGTVNSSDRAQLEQLHGQIRDEIDQEERVVREPGGEAEFAPLARLALHGDMPAHQLGQLLGDGEAETCPAILAGGRGICLFEGLEQPLDLRFRHADAGIADREFHD